MLISALHHLKRKITSDGTNRRAHAIVLLLLTSLGAPAQSKDQPKIELTVGGAVEKPLKLSAAEIAKLPRTTVRAKDHGGNESTFEGVALFEFLKLAGVPLGEKLKGKAVSDYLVIDATDGYRAVFAIPEVDPAFTDLVILLPDKRDGKPLSEAEGPLRIVVPHEKRQARWVRQVTSLTILRAGDR